MWLYDRALSKHVQDPGSKPPPPIKTILKREISLSTYTHFKRNSPEKEIFVFSQRIKYNLEINSKENLFTERTGDLLQ